MASGGLVLSFTDLVLPGYNGMDQRVSRVLNVATDGSSGWFVGIPGPLAVVLGTPDDPDQNPNPVIQSADGGSELTFAVPSDEPGAVPVVFMTRGYAKLTTGASGHTLELPDGTHYHFNEPTGDPKMWLVTAHDDQFGNSIVYQYDTGHVLQAVTQHVGATTRVVVFTREPSPIDQYRSKTKVTWGDRTWEYNWYGLELETRPPSCGSGVGACRPFSWDTPDAGVRLGRRSNDA
jgi:hypothetical protein